MLILSPDNVKALKVPHNKAAANQKAQKLDKPLTLTQTKCRHLLKDYAMSDCLVMVSVTLERLHTLQTYITSFPKKTFFHNKYSEHVKTVITVSVTTSF